MSVRFDAATDRISGPASPAPPDTATGITGCFWAFLSVDQAANETLFRLHAASGATTRLTLATLPATTTPALFSIGNGGGVSSPLGLSTTAFRRIGFTCTGTTGTIYAGDDAGGATVSASGTVSGGATASGFTLGGRSASDSTEWLNGRLAYLRLWSTVLSQAEIEAEWAASAPVRTSGLWADYPLTAHTDLTDHSGNGRNLVAGSTAVTTEADPPVGGPPTTSPVIPRRFRTGVLLDM